MKWLSILSLILVSFMASLLSGTGYAVEEFDSSQPVEWQKIKFEDQLRRKLKDSILAGVGDRPFVLTVSVDLKPQLKDEKKDQKKKDKKKEDLVPLGKLDMDAPYLYDEDGKRADQPDIFKLILKVKVNLVLDSSVSDAKKDVLKRILLGIVGSLGEQPPEVVVDKIDLVTPPAPKEEKSWDFKRWIVELKNPVMLLLVTLLFGMYGVILFSRYQRLENRKIAVLEAQSAREEAVLQKQSEEKAETEPTGVQTPTPESPASVLGEASNKGFEQFESLMKTSLGQVASLVKQWIRAPGKGAREALVVLPQMLPTEELLSIFDKLTLEDRKEWKRILNTPVDSSALRVADAFISTQIVESILVPMVEVDDELQRLIGDLKISECVELATQSSELGALLVNLLPTSQVSLMFALLSVDVANSVTAASLKISDEDLKSKAPSLKTAISNIKGKSKSGAAPFLDKAIDMLKDVAPEKEGSIFNALVEAQEYSLLESAAKKIFPSELILKLPEKIIKTALDRLPVSRRADFIFSQEETNRALFLDAIGKAESKARALVDVEIDQIGKDETRKRRIEKGKVALWKQFAETVRNLINSNESIAEQAESVLNAWLSEKSGGQIGGQGASSSTG